VPSWLRACSRAPRVVEVVEAEALIRAPFL
jgi:hypothetical protein